MSLFGSSPTLNEATTAKISEHVRDVVKDAVDQELERLDAGRDVEKDQRAAEAELIETKTKLANLQINYDREQEKHERTTREIEHKVGLHKKQVEHEITAARKESELNVMEQNLKAEKERFEKEIKFMRERFETEVGYLREMMGEVLNRLPEVKVERTYTTEEHIGEKPARAPKKVKALEA